MAQDLYERFDSVKRRFDEAAEVLDFDLAAFCFNGPEEELRQTRVTQPALFVHSVVVSELLAERGILPVAAAGHSLGEYSALACAGVFDFRTGLRLVKVRADAMQRAGEERPGAMAAVVGIEFETVEQICREVADVGVVVPANYNSPGQLVISGEVRAVEHAIELCKASGAKLARKLVVSGAFHSPLMSSASKALEEALEEAVISSPRFPVMSNATGRPHSTPQAVRRALVDQLLAPVRWTDCLQALSEMGHVHWFEIGPGNVLAGLLKRTVSGAFAQTVGTVAEIEEVTAGATA